MQILAICGSTRAGGSNALLLSAFAKTYPEHMWRAAPGLGELPLFTTEALAAGRGGLPEVLAKAVKEADAVVIATPEYAHNMPAALKSAFEWLVASGEFSRKPVIAITCTPHPPRGEKCMQSLVWTLQALDAQVVVQCPVYDVAGKVDASGTVTDSELTETMATCMELLSS